MVDKTKDGTANNESVQAFEDERSEASPFIESAVEIENTDNQNDITKIPENAGNTEKQKPTRKIICELIETVLLVLLVFMTIRVMVHNYQVEGLSMYPGLDNGEFLIVNRWSYSWINLNRFSKVIPGWDVPQNSRKFIFGEIKHGDIVVFKDPVGGNKELIKRAIGLPGDTLEIASGRVYIDGYPLEEPYLNQYWTGDYPVIVIPDGFIYVLGDNRNNSLDSRSINIGLVPITNIAGKAIFLYWPLDAFGPIKSEHDLR